MSSFLITKKEAKTFEDKINKLAKHTQDNVNASIRSFDKFCNEYHDNRNYQEIFEELKTLKGKEQTEAVRELLQNWIDWQYNRGSLTSGIQQYLSKIKRIFSHNGIKIGREYFDEPLEFKPKIREELHALTIDEIRQIFKYANPKKLGFYLALSCTGARPGELLQVRKKDVDVTQKRVKIRIEAENVKTRSGRSIWLTKEASRPLISRLRTLEDNDLVWATNEKFAFAEKNESTQFSKICDKAGFTEKYKSNNFRMITLYSFRSFFFGKASDVHREGYAHNMIGHGGYLPQYDRMSDEKKLEWFLELEPKLLIDNTLRLQEENKKQSQKIIELNQKDDIIMELTKRLSDVEKILKSNNTS